MTISMALTQVMVPTLVGGPHGGGLTLLLVVGVVGNAVVMGVVARFAHRSAHVATSQDKTALALAPALAALAAGGAVTASQLVTVLLVAQAAVAILTGLGFLCVSRLGAARVIAWVPTDLTIGLAAATGLGLIKAGFSLGLLVHAAAPTSGTVAVLATSFWLVFALRTGWGLLGPLCGAVALAWIGWALGLGWVQPTTPPDQTFIDPALALAAVAPVPMATLLPLWPGIVVAALATLLFGVINLSLVPDRANDARALRGLGLANLCAGALGGAAGHTAPGPTALAAGTPLPHRTTGIAALSLMAAVPVLNWVLWAIPPLVICACLVLLGVLLLQTAVWPGLRTTRADIRSRAVPIVMGGAVLMTDLVTATCLGVLLTLAIRLLRWIAPAPSRLSRHIAQKAEP